MIEQAVLFEHAAVASSDKRFAAAKHMCRQFDADAVGISVAERLVSMGADTDTCIAAMLGDPSLQDEIDGVAISENFGPVVANLVKHVRWLNALPGEAQNQPSSEQSERVRRMVLAIVDDVRAVFIKLAYRLQRLHNLPRESYAMRQAVARETLDIYSPLANRLGLGRLKWEMEDLAFRYLEPQAYKTLANALEEKRVLRERYVADFVTQLNAALSEDGLHDFDASGRPKHIYSIWRKMQRKQLAFSDIFDVRAVRVLVNTVSECYLALGAVHSRWRHIPSEFDDYIANPKKNSYRSLHTAIVGPQGKAVEVQIRTRGMHEFAEYGVAAHWQYKEGGESDEYLRQTVRELRGLLEEGADEALLDNFRTEVHADRVFVFTPQGEVIDLPSGATPLDFAYAVHTHIGHRCRGARINGRIVNLRTQLRNGDHVEILTTKQSKPSRDWLNKDLGYLISSRARAKVRHWFNQQDIKQHAEEGRMIVERELRRLGKRGLSLEKLNACFHRENSSDLYVAVGKNEITAAQLAQAVESLEQPQTPVVERLDTRRGRSSPDAGVTVQGVGNLLTQFAKCCNPVPVDAIVGYLTRTSGVKIHRADCRNVLRFGVADSDRLVDVDWSDHGTDVYAAAITVIAHDRRGLLSDISAIVALEGIAINSAHTDTDKRRNVATLRLRMEVQDFRQLSRLMEKISQLRNVIDVVRDDG
ncbi:MAG: bifunctional (p)ppGpp synthetase/guanosine-3',5'-bis(diphosphate) 3'-pyrophosphohydrolase [Gammaproteobacteria bacterium]|nr:bifunctional (p)ppGpp synthetase/guanosine-3',5'-bis(diphosphate) 3'-pyrophosphohydrolase [Gammaproteobacteria bacterium]